MDDFSIQDDRIDIALKELRIINRFLGGITTTRTALKKFICSKDDEISILDIGSASSDNLLAAKKYYPRLNIISFDKNIRSLKFFPDSTLKLNADAFKIPIKDNSCDIVHASLFLHHFTEKEIVSLLKEFFRINKKGIIINDLQRSYFALGGIKLLTSLFSKSEFVSNDAPLSVKRGFKKNELLRIFIDSGLESFIIKRKWAFRWMAVIKKNDKRN
jgi:ubiquinone/menaquinone biosynthesis C-methylase UbiE